MVISDGRRVATVFPKNETPVAGDGVPNCPFAITTVVNPEDWNAFSPILVTDDGMVMDVNDIQDSKAMLPILITDGSVMDANLTQL